MESKVEYHIKCRPPDSQVSGAQPAVVWVADLCWHRQQDFLPRCRAVVNNLDRLMLVILRHSGSLLCSSQEE